MVRPSSIQTGMSRQNVNKSASNSARSTSGGKVNGRSSGRSFSAADSSAFAAKTASVNDNADTFVPSSNKVVKQQETNAKASETAAAKQDNVETTANSAKKTTETSAKAETQETKPGAAKTITVDAWAPNQNDKNNCLWNIAKNNYGDALGDDQILDACKTIADYNGMNDINDIIYDGQELNLPELETDENGKWTGNIVEQPQVDADGKTIVPDDFVGPLTDNQVRESDAKKTDETEAEEEKKAELEPEDTEEEKKAELEPEKTEEAESADEKKTDMEQDSNKGLSDDVVKNAEDFGKMLTSIGSGYEEDSVILNDALSFLSSPLNSDEEKTEYINQIYDSMHSDEDNSNVSDSKKAAMVQQELSEEINWALTGDNDDLAWDVYWNIESLKNSSSNKTADKTTSETAEKNAVDMGTVDTTESGKEQETTQESKEDKPKEGLPQNQDMDAYLEQYMEEHDCTKEEAIAELEAKYGKPEKPQKK